MVVGNYVRTKSGITRIKENVCLLDDVIKSSPNIIDLIQEGDYVNGLRVDVIKNGQLLNANSYDGWLVNIASDSDEIKTIVTKEQFESIQYEVE